MDRIINIAFQAPVLQDMAEHGFILLCGVWFIITDGNPVHRRFPFSYEGYYSTPFFQRQSILAWRGKLAVSDRYPQASEVRGLSQSAGQRGRKRKAGNRHNYITGGIFLFFIAFFISLENSKSVH